MFYFLRLTSPSLSPSCLNLFRKYSYFFVRICIFPSVPDKCPHLYATSLLLFPASYIWVTVFLQIRPLNCSDCRLLFCTASPVWFWLVFLLDHSSRDDICSGSIVLFTLLYTNSSNEPWLLISPLTVYFVQGPYFRQPLRFFQPSFSILYSFL